MLTLFPDKPVVSQCVNELQVNAQFLDDRIQEHRSLGIAWGLEIMKRFDELWVFGDSISEGMQAEIEAAEQRGIPVIFHSERCERR